MFNLALWVYVGLALAIFGSIATVWGPGVKDPIIRTINSSFDFNCNYNYCNIDLV